jgi:LuxR family transcriptional regulator, quorum-sensing system regulator BjaR1
MGSGFPFPGDTARSAGSGWGGPKAAVVERDLPLLHLIALSAFELLRRLRRPPGVPIPLTPREREVLSWAAQGKSAWETGEILGIAKRTVDEHVQTASRKLNAVNRTQAVVAALRERFISV